MFLFVTGCGLSIWATGEPCVGAGAAEDIDNDIVEGVAGDGDVTVGEGLDGGDIEVGVGVLAPDETAPGRGDTPSDLDRD